MSEEKNLNEEQEVNKEETPVNEEVTEVVEVLEENPQIFQKVYGEKRRAVTKRFGYNLIYIIISPFVYILAILHGKRNPEEWKGRK